MTALWAKFVIQECDVIGVPFVGTIFCQRLNPSARTIRAIKMRFVSKIKTRNRHQITTGASKLLKWHVSPFFSRLSAEFQSYRLLVGSRLLLPVHVGRNKGEEILVCIRVPPGFVKKREPARCTPQVTKMVKETCGV
jgi:hypothetical protein